MSCERVRVTERARGELSHSTERYSLAFPDFRKLSKIKIFGVLENFGFRKLFK